VQSLRSRKTEGFQMFLSVKLSLSAFFFSFKLTFK
jgi:hypothetical protein